MTPASSARAYADTRVMVLGASGFIGKWVMRALATQGAQLHAVVRGRGEAATREWPSARAVVADLGQRGVVQPIIDDLKPSIVFNLAGYGVDHSERDPELMRALNARLVGELCEALEGQTPAGPWPGLRLVHAGSALEYGRVSGELREEMTPDPTTDYGRTKLEGTAHVAQAASRSGLKGSVARLFTVYGPGEHAGRLLPSLVGAARTGRRLKLTAGAQCRDFTYVEDVAEGLLRLGASEVPPGAIVNVATGSLTSVRSFAETAAAVLGLDSSALEFGAVETRSDEMFHARVDTTKLERLLSWKPVTTVAEGIRRTWAYQPSQPSHR